MFHLNVRVAWHDNRWNGAVCQNPALNSFCMDLDRIRKERSETTELQLSGKWFADIPPADIPPCRAEAGAFMNDREWVRIVQHPYANNNKTQATHGHLRPTNIIVKPYSTFAVPFYWMLRANQQRIEESLPGSLPPDEEAPFKSAWVFSRARQEALSEIFFSRLLPGQSLVFFYTKSGHPLDESFSRLLVGVGRIERISPMLRYETCHPDKTNTYPLWDRLFHHSIRLDGDQGFLLPYHEYLEPTGDFVEDTHRKELLSTIAVVPERKDIMAFSYAGEHAAPEVALSALVKCLEAVRKIRDHGIASGPWAQRENWLNEQIASVWVDRGAFPGAGSALEAIGMRLGTSLVLELMASGQVKPLDDPWVVLDAILRGRAKPPQSAYAADIKAVAKTWEGLHPTRRSLLRLLSRFSLSPQQMRRWFEPRRREQAVRHRVDDRAILENPYRIAEVDFGDMDDCPISVATIDRGMLPDARVAAAHPVEAPSRMDSSLDHRRVRAGLVTILRHAADQGDALLTESDALARMETLELAQPCVASTDWLNGNHAYLTGEIEQAEVILDPAEGIAVNCLQLTDLSKGEHRLASLLRGRTAAPLASLGEDWAQLLIATLEEGGIKVNQSDLRHAAALKEQAEALERATCRKLSVLIGSAGTGKTTVLGALLKSPKLRQDGVLFLAPTGKARVRLAQKAQAEAMTVAQFLYALDRYDSIRQRVLFTGQEQRRKERTVVIDECSMLTMNDLLATLLALDLGHVQRIILVGDPNQLPPIGVGRPFADLVAHLEALCEAKIEAGEALARLTVELRTTAGAPSDTLRLASWFNREPQPVDADRILGDITSGTQLNDLDLCFWQTPGELYTRLEEQFVSRLRLTAPEDIQGFNAALGLTEAGWVPFDDHNGAENFQLLSPVRLHPYGVHALNRWIQQRYRQLQLRSARQPWGLSLGDEEIVWGDKVILTRNGRRAGWDSKRQAKSEEYLANGEIGIACQAMGGMKNKLLNVAFANRPDVRFGFEKQSFSADASPLELAYALTVHKAQGSEFRTVFVIIPKTKTARSRFLSRELLYTALTRSRDRLVLLIEGTDASALFALAKPENSEIARRNTNLFTGGVRRDGELFPYAAHLVHRTTRDEMVQSKSELAIANYLHGRGLPYYYIRPFTAVDGGRTLYPDFTFIKDSGDLILWEHLGMLDQAGYRSGWDWKRAWYQRHGFIEGVNLFTTAEGPGLDMQHVMETADRVEEALET
ncbi:MAG TPA: ATP-dependent RecD-like DNA helicase [Candidatus Tectomicrobia bacterium]